MAFFRRAIPNKGIKNEDKSKINGKFSKGFGKIGKTKNENSKMAILEVNGLCIGEFFFAFLIIKKRLFQIAKKSKNKMGRGLFLA